MNVRCYISTSPPLSEDEDDEFHEPSYEPIDQSQFDEDHRLSRSLRLARTTLERLCVSLDNAENLIRSLVRLTHQHFNHMMRMCDSEFRLANAIMEANLGQYGLDAITLSSTAEWRDWCDRAGERSKQYSELIRRHLVIAATYMIEEIDSLRADVQRCRKLECRIMRLKRKYWRKRRLPRTGNNLVRINTSRLTLVSKETEFMERSHACVRRLSTMTVEATRKLWHTVSAFLNSETRWFISCHQSFHERPMIMNLIERQSRLTRIQAIDGYFSRLDRLGDIMSRSSCGLTTNAIVILLDDQGHHMADAAPIHRLQAERLSLLASIAMSGASSPGLSTATTSGFGDSRAMQAHAREYESDTNNDPYNNYNPDDEDNDDGCDDDNDEASRII